MISPFTLIATATIRTGHAPFLSHAKRANFTQQIVFFRRRLARMIKHYGTQLSTTQTRAPFVKD
jgi:hypothetical protein